MIELKSASTTLVSLVDPQIAWTPKKKGVVHDIADGSVAVDLIAVKFIYEVSYAYLTADDFDIVEGWISRLGNSSEDMFLTFTWKDRVHDGLTFNTSCNRILGKVFLDPDTLEVSDFFGESGSDTRTGKAIKFTLQEV
jgi:hypothetical protein